MDQRVERIQAALEGLFNILLPPRRVEEFIRFDSVLGQGGFATVYRGVATEKAKNIPALRVGATYAVKRPAKNSKQEIQKSLEQLPVEREIEFLTAISGDRPTCGLVRLVAIFLELPWQTSLVMEFLEGPNLFDYLSTRVEGRLAECDAALLARQMLGALHFLHRTAGALHRDVKPDNFGFTKLVLPGQPLPKLKLFDLGSAWVLPAPLTEETALEMQPLPRSGTLLYLAPETWRGLGGAPSDLWAVGLLVHLLLTQELPFGLMERNDYRHAIQEPLNLATLAWAGISGLAAELVAALLAKRPEERPTSSAVLASPWLAQNEALHL